MTTLTLTDDVFPDNIFLTRMANLVKLLRTVSPDHFDLRDWISGDTLTDKRKMLHQLYMSSPYPEFSCGTTACACGHAALHPWFKKQGLMLSAQGWPFYKGKMGFRAIEEFFQIDSILADELFGHMAYSSGNRDLEGVIHRIIFYFPQLKDV